MNLRRTLVRCALLGTTAIAALAAGHEPATVTGRLGPWGQLRRTAFRLSPPVPVVADRPVRANGQWRFTKPTWAEIDAELASLTLSPARRAALTDPARRSVDPTGTVRIIDVPDDVRLELGPEARAHLYDLLAGQAGTSRYGIPFVLPPEATIEKANLNPELRARMRQLTFMRGDRRCIVDADLLMPVVQTPEERVRLLRLLFSVRTLSVELTRASLGRRDEAVAYWRQPSGKTADTVLRRFEQNPELASVDLQHLLPPLPQRLLNGFPDGANCPAMANCFWSSLNFFAVTPDNRFLPDEKDDAAVMDVVVSSLQSGYRKVGPPYGFGDILLYYSQDEEGIEPVHMAVYIADDIVFTKNGIGIFSPFILAHRTDMEELYAWIGELEVQGYRKKK